MSGTVTCASGDAGDAGATCSDGSPLCTLKGSLNLPNGGAYVVRVTDPAPYDVIDAYGDWGTFVVTNPSGKLSSSGQPTGSGLHTGRRALGATSGRINSASRFLYAIGGTSSTGGTGGTVPTGTPLASIERAIILDPAGAPLLSDPPTMTAGTGTLLGCESWTSVLRWSLK